MSYNEKQLSRIAMLNKRKNQGKITEDQFSQGMNKIKTWNTDTKTKTPATQTTTRGLSSINNSNPFGDTHGSTNYQKPHFAGVQTSNPSFENNKNINLNTIQQGRDAGAIFFGNKVLDYNNKNPNNQYLTQRNDLLAVGLWNEGKKSREDIANYLSQYDDFNSFDEGGKRNTVNAIYNRMGELYPNNNGQNSNNGNITTQYNNSNQYTNQGNNQNNTMNTNNNGYWETVNSVMMNNFGIKDLDAFRERYGDENYVNLMKALKVNENGRNKTDPEARNRLEGNISEVLESGIELGADQSRLNLIKEMNLRQFAEKDRKTIEERLLQLGQLSQEGKNYEEIANIMGVDSRHLGELIKLNQGLPSKLGEYYNLSDEARAEVSEPFDIRKKRMQEDYEYSIAQKDQDLKRLYEDYTKNRERQEKQNEINLHNTDLLMGLSGVGFSRRGLEGFANLQEQAKNILDDMFTNYDRSKTQINSIKEQLTKAYMRDDEDNIKQLNEALTATKNNYISMTQQIQNKYGLVSLEGQERISNAVKEFATNVYNIYEKAKENRMRYTNNLIDGVSKLGKLEEQAINLNNVKIQQFQGQSMYMTRNDLESFARHNGLQGDFEQLARYQTEATVNTLNSYSTGLGSMMYDKIETYLNQGYTPQHAIQKILNSPEVKAMGGGNAGEKNWSMSGDYIYNKSTGEVRNILEQGEKGEQTTTGGYTQEQVGINTEQVKTVLEDIATTKVGQPGGQCGAFANDYLQNVMGESRVFVDPIDKKKAVMNSDVPVVGAIAIMDSPLAPEYGHVAIVKEINDDGTITVIDSNNKGDEKISMSKMNTKNISGYYIPEKLRVSATINDYQKNILVARLGKQIYGTRISDKESERVEKFITEGMKKGKNQYDIIDDVVGYNINKKANKGLAKTVRDILISNAEESGLAGYDMINFANLLNKGDNKKAIEKLELTIYNKDRTGDQGSVLKARDSLTRYSIKKGDELIKEIENISNSLGMVAGRVNKKRSKFAKSEDFVKLEAGITAYISEWRNKMIGANATEIEMKMIEPLVANVKDNPRNAIQKIKQFEQMNLDQFNSRRSMYGLPVLTKEAVGNMDEKLSIYLGNNSTKTRGGIMGKDVVNINNSTPTTNRRTF